MSGEIRRSGRKALAALGAAAGENIAAANSRHARAETMAALADELRGLVGALHVLNSVLGLKANDSNYMIRIAGACPETIAFRFRNLDGLMREKRQEVNARPNTKAELCSRAGDTPYRKDRR
jgi:hypothetical protein